MYISKRVFLTIITLFIVIFFLFMSLTIYGNILADDDFINEHASQEVVDTLSDALNSEGINIDSSSSLLESVIQDDVISSKPRNVALILTADNGITLELLKRGAVYISTDTKFLTTGPNLLNLKNLIYLYVIIFQKHHMI